MVVSFLVIFLLSVEQVEAMPILASMGARGDSYDSTKVWSSRLFPFQGSLAHKRRIKIQENILPSENEREIIALEVEIQRRVLS